jgi:prolyl oligopeptidase
LAAPDASDPYIALEDVSAPSSLEWVKTRNARTVPALQAYKRHAQIEKEVRKILLATDRIPSPAYRGGLIYNFWQDKKNVKGIWRRTTLKEYAKPKPHWTTLLDLDTLAKKESKSWVWKGARCLEPEGRRCLLLLSEGGADAVIVREFDVADRKFIKDGFILPQAKTRIAWLDLDTLLVATDFGPGTLTDSGYPRLVKHWKRGMPLASAKTIFEGQKTDVSISPWVHYRKSGTVAFIERNPSFFTNIYFLLDQSSLALTKVELPEDIDPQGLYQNQLIAKTRTDWKVGRTIFKSGNLVSIPMSTFSKPVPTQIYAPDSRSAIGGVMITSEAIYLSVMEDVKGRVYRLERQGDSPGTWKTDKIEFPDAGDISLVSSDAEDTLMLASYESFVTPATIYALGQGPRPLVPQSLRKVPDRFNSSKLEVNQYKAKSADGTMVPYFVIHSKKLVLNGNNPTVLYGYGGFEVSETPYYLNTIGKVWLERGGVFVTSNIRGGGEYGPSWHDTAILKNRQRAYDDFIAIAEDLIVRKITSPRRLGIMGGSNGGLLVGATMVQRPELFNAVVCQVPLLDMFRYNKLLAGASWMGEYGDPADPEMRKVIGQYSPYQNVKKGVKYPPIFFLTSTKDDRVHPGHARKMAARMEEQGHPYYFYENVEGGHSAAADLEQSIKRKSLEFVYLFKHLVD